MENRTRIDLPAHVSRPFEGFVNGVPREEGTDYDIVGSSLVFAEPLMREGPIGFWLGDSRARWEGDTLVVDVVDFNEETWLDRAGNFHSDQLHVVERWSFVDANTIAYRATLEDPQVYTRPWDLSVLLHRHREPNFQLVENYCFTLDYDRFYPVPSSQ